MIELYNTKTGELSTVASWPTASPHFVITKPISNPDIDTSEFFNVTHVRSTAIALGPFRDPDVARMCAVIMGSLPLPWDEFSMAVSRMYKQPDPKQMERFKEAWSKLPPEIHKWQKAVSDACLDGEL
jgi:hypothetical protein